jgi:hypothetical protein
MTVIAKITGENVVFKHLKINCGVYYSLWMTPAGNIVSQKGGLPVSFQLVASSPYGSIVSYQIIGGYLPIGLSLDNTGLISGTSSAVGTTTTYMFIVQTEDDKGRIDTRAFNIQLIGSNVVWVTPTGELGPVGINGPVNLEVEAIVE